jgi:hypothetical protein
MPRNVFCWTANRISPCHLLLGDLDNETYIGHENDTTLESVCAEALAFKAAHPEFKVEVWPFKCPDYDLAFDQKPCHAIMPVVWWRRGIDRHADVLGGEMVWWDVLRHVGHPFAEVSPVVALRDFARPGLGPEVRDRSRRGAVRRARRRGERPPGRQAGRHAAGLARRGQPGRRLPGVAADGVPVGLAHLRLPLLRGCGMSTWAIYRNGMWWVFAPAGSTIEGGWTADPLEASLMSRQDAERWCRRVGGVVVKVNKTDEEA